MSIFDDDFPDMKPGDETTIVESGHTFRITATDQSGGYSGRRRYRVMCETCTEEVHYATTGPKSHAELHIRQFERASAQIERHREESALAVQLAAATPTAHLVRTFADRTIAQTIEVQRSIARTYASFDALRATSHVYIRDEPDVAVAIQNRLYVAHVGMQELLALTLDETRMARFREIPANFIEVPIRNGKT